MKLSKQKTRILVIVGIVVVICAITIPTALFLSYRADVAEREDVEKKLQQLIDGFKEQHGQGASIVDLVEPDKLYIFIWDREGTRHYTLSIDGLFVELGTFELEE